ncbi:unnamed protein product [Danaus chrysippus]|uniref:(African queen) hypothetical protein n=1 Tax=Danaus chrysippus TaxID=151541 RepID=A0A8J2MEX4_9NEOP|nr:unnamed protein product [Danaus chrysippus]
MFNIESYVTPILLSYVDKYVRDFKPADAQVSLWAGGVTLHNLVIKADVLQKEVALPFTLVSGRIHELLIQVPWTKIMSEPIVVTINTIECILSLHPPPEETPPSEQPRTQVVEAPPGYMQALVRRIVSNIAVRVHSLIVKYVQDDIVLSLNVKRLAVDSVGTDWEPSFADIDQNQPAIRRLVRLDDLTLCLDKSDSDGKIRFYQEPLLYRCQLDLRVLTRLVSANTRRARSLTVQLRSGKLAFGVTSEQMVLLLRLIRERNFEKQPPPVVKTASVNLSAPLHPISSNTAEPTRSESWSEWAWSWLPTWMDRDGVEETPAPAAPVPVAFTAHLDHVSLVFKIMEVESNNRKRARGVLELNCIDAVIKSSLCSPTLIRVRVGAKTVTIQSIGKCVCGHIDINAANDEPTVYLCKVVSEHDMPWSWEDVDLNEVVVETAVAAEEELREVSENETQQTEKPNVEPRPGVQTNDEGDQFWQKMAPVIYFEYNHDRTPLNNYVNPYDNPPGDFEYSDWIEDSNVKISIRPILISVTTGLLHRLAVVKNVFQEVPLPADREPSMRILTVEENEALSENLPQRHTAIDITGLRIKMSPWDHSLVEKPAEPPLVLDLQLPKATVLITGPLYPHRVCSAACQVPGESGPLWQGSNLHISATVTAVQLGICTNDTPRPCARADLRFVTHTLLNSNYFGKDSVFFSYNLKIREANFCGSSARLQAACQVINSIVAEKYSLPLRYTTLAKDALGDEESVAIDITLEELSIRGYLTRNINTHIVTMQSARATAFHSPTGGQVKQAWLFSAPEAPTTVPYIRVAVQWCKDPTPDMLEYAGVWIEPTAFSVDPLLVAWLGYRPKLKIVPTDTVPQVTSLRSTSSSQYLRRRATPPVSHSDVKSSSGRGGSRSGSGAELVHVRPRSQESSSERSERKDIKPPPKVTRQVSQWTDDKLLQLHERLNRLLITAEIGLVLVYVTSSSVSAVDFATVRDAMERHAETGHRVLVLSLGRLSMHSNSQMKYIWQEVRHDHPTLRRPRQEANVTEDSFPWKTRLADVSCYTLEVQAGASTYGREKSASGLRSQLKSTGIPMPRTVLDLVTTTVTLSVVTKSLQIKTRKFDVRHRHTEHKEEDRTKFFTSGVDFKPSSLKEFIRGPVRFKKSPEPEETPPAPEPVPAQTTIKSGPVVSLGVNLHADTPPVLVRLDQDQVQAVSIAIHCFSHIVSLLTRQSVVTKTGFSSVGSSTKSLRRSVSEMDARQSLSEEASDNHSEQLISIFESHEYNALDTKLKTFFWFQWVVSRATIVVATPQVKLAIVIDDVISTVDLQEHYNQLKVKVASASIRHYKRTSSDDWTPGVLGGRIIEVREPANAKEENHFLAVTITQASISNLPVSWKEELHPKLLEQNANIDSMWEVYATLAPLEAVLQPDVLDYMLCWLHDLTPQAMCPLTTDDQSSSSWQWPFFYVTAGGLRLLLTNGEEDNDKGDDTFMLIIGKVSVNPHPDNPICRQSINVVADNNWSSPAPGFEGRQYEVLVKNLGFNSARFSQIVNEEATESEILKGTGSENPALKWSQPIISPIITPILHSMDVSCVLAPPIYSCGAMTCGAAVELNLLSDCVVELAACRLCLMQEMAQRFAHALRHREDSSFVLEEDASCPYLPYLVTHEPSDTSPTDSETTLFEGRCESEGAKSVLETSRSYMFDSGFETASHSTYKIRRDSSSVPLKKSVSIAGVDYTAKSSDFLEVFITMGTIDVSLYARDDGSPEITELKPPPGIFKPQEPDKEVFNQIKVTVVEKKSTPKVDDSRGSMTACRSLTETHRNADVGKTKLDRLALQFARETEGNVPLVHATLQQPNFYYRKRRKQKTIQISLFDAWFGLGAGPNSTSWNEPLMITANGTNDPVTDIPPALATLRIDLASGGYMTLTSGNPKGAVKLEIERPVLFEVSADRIRRVKKTIELVKKTIECQQKDSRTMAEHKSIFLYNMRRYMVANQVENISLHTGQVGVRGSEGVAGWGALRVQVAAGNRPEKMNCRLLLSALLLSTGAPTECRHVLLQPMIAGAVLDATWEAWRRAEGGPSAKEPTIRMGIDLDHITIDLRPSDMTTIVKIIDTLKESLESETPSESPSAEFKPVCGQTRSSFYVPHTNSETSDQAYHYYKDDLRSGAFKIITGGQLPMAYQVMLHGSTVSWRYPHPRAIIRLVAFPIPGHVEEVECALELYCPLLMRWETYAYFQLPVNDPQELQFSVTPEDAVFALMWRVRACSDTQQKSQPFEFDAKKFLPRHDPLAGEPVIESDYYRQTCRVSAEQVSGALRVDSYFAPRLLPRARLALRLAGVEIHVHNDIRQLSKQTSFVEGYYVSRPLMRSHRVLSLRTRDSAIHAIFASASRVLFDMHVSTDLIDSATGTMQELVQQFHVQGTLSLCSEPRLRLRAGDLRVNVHVPGVSTIRALADDWSDVISGATIPKSERIIDVTEHHVESIEKCLEGRVSLWVHNSCAAALRVGQEGTDEIVPLSSGAALAYRWRSPIASKKLRFAVASPSADWHWSSSIPFSGSARVRVEDSYLYVHVTDSGSRRDMYLSGRLVLANVLRHNLLYKVRSQCPEKKIWQTVSSGELLAENVGLSVLCKSDCESILKIKFTSHESGWSGDIPLKECRKENVPWLVKVPSAGDVSYTSVWCRVVRARNTGRIMATIWPFYILRSYLSLDADVLISSDSSPPQSTDTPIKIVQTASGHGATTHLNAPGTTAARHTLTFQYRNLDCPVTRDAVPLHYGVTETSVFEKPPSINDLEEAIDVVQKWIKSSGKEAKSLWPYSIVRKHWPGTWSPALLQPRCDVTVRYTPVRACGGCSLELRLCPVVLLANASPVALTLRAHDATPLCRLEPGMAIAPPSAVVQKPFFMSVEMGRETFVSGQLQVCKEEPGRYGTPAPGHVTLDRATDFAIQCNQKVALLTMYYEIKEDINVMGITSTYILMNRLNRVILVAAIAIPNEMDTKSVLRPKAFKLVHPTKENSLEGTPLCRFWVSGRWRGGDAEELRTFLCFALPTEKSHSAPVPVALGTSPVRRSIALTDDEGQSVCVTVTQVRHEARWVVTVAPDPCPQLVVQNHTATALMVAEPVATENPTNNVEAVNECTNVLWWCNVEAGRMTHYSTPGYCARYPPPQQTTKQPLPVITVRRASDGFSDWSQPIAIADGEQLVQLSGGVTIKIRIRTHPHSTLVELQDVDENDISASDIRRRLIGVFSEESLSLQEEKEMVLSYTQKKLRRTSAADKLLEPKLEKEISENTQAEEVTLLSADRQTDLLSASQIVTEETPPQDKSNENDDKNDQKKDDKKDTDQTVMTVDTRRVSIPEANTSDVPSAVTVARNDSNELSETSILLEEVYEKDLNSSSATWSEVERVRCVIGSIAVTFSGAPDVLPLLALHLQRAAIIVNADSRKIRTTISVSDVQIDNAQYETEQYDFAVVATTRSEGHEPERWPPLWGMTNELFATRRAEAKLLLQTCNDKWTVAGTSFNELMEVELRLGPLGLYIEDAYLGAAIELYHLAVPMKSHTSESLVLAECRTLQNPVRLRKLHVHPLNLTLTLHTAVRMYIALDESPLRLSAFMLQDVMTSPERLTHAFTVHYLSAAILGAGWVVGGLELLGAPGALAARVGSAGGGVRGVASAAAAALLRSLSAAAGSLARNLDLLAGDHEHARRAAAARRRPPQSLMAGLVAGITNFAINILGAVGGLAHHPLVGVAVGESGSGAAALRRGILGAITKPLSATADLVAYAGHGLLTQTGWDTIPQPRPSISSGSSVSGWRRDCVRWSFRLAELNALAGYDALLDQAALHLLLTHKFLVIADPETERIVEMIDFKTCTLGPYEGQIIEIHVSQKRAPRISESRAVVDEDNEYHISAAAMARVARYTGAEGYNSNESRVLTLLPAPGVSHALYAALAAALHHNANTHFPFM